MTHYACVCINKQILMPPSLSSKKGEDFEELLNHANHIKAWLLLLEKDVQIDLRTASEDDFEKVKELSYAQEPALKEFRRLIQPVLHRMSAIEPLDANEESLEDSYEIDRIVSDLGMSDDQQTDTKSGLQIFTKFIADHENDRCVAYGYALPSTIALDELPVKQVTSEITLCNSPNDFIKAICPLQIVKRKDVTVDDYVFASKLNLFQNKLRDVHGKDSSQPDCFHQAPSPDIHPKFIESSTRAVLQKRSKSILAAIVLLCSDDGAYAEDHSLNVKHGGKQRVRGKCKAMRRKLSAGGDRLHYWVCPDNKKEIGCAVSHDNFDIPE